MSRQCPTCRHGPNPTWRAFPDGAGPGCKRMVRIDEVYSELSDKRKEAAVDLSEAIVAFLHAAWSAEYPDEVDDACRGWQMNEQKDRRQSRSDRDRNWRGYAVR